MVTIIFPSRGRPQRAKEVIDKWITRSGLADQDIELVLSLDSDDPELWNYSRRAPLTNFSVFINDNRSAIDAINIVAKFYSEHRGKPGDFLIVISDDFDCPENWGKTLSQTIGEEEDRIYKTFDGIQGWIITLPIMGWKYYNRFGYVYHPSYKHMFCDTELTCVAEMTGRWSELASSGEALKFRHLCNSIPKDDLNKRNDATFEQGKQNFIERKKRNFDLKLEDIKFEMTRNVYTVMQ